MSRPSDKVRGFVAALRAVERTSEARFKLPLGSTRARVTSANARLNAACEHRDRLRRLLTNEEEAEAETILKRSKTR